MSVSMRWRDFGHLQLLSRAESPFTVVAEMEVGPQDGMANPQGRKMFPVEKHGLPEDFVPFRTLCGVQSSPPVFAPNRAFVCGPLQRQASVETLCFRSALSPGLSAKVRRENSCNS